METEMELLNTELASDGSLKKYRMVNRNEYRKPVSDVSFFSEPLTIYEFIIRCWKPEPKRSKVKFTQEKIKEEKQPKLKPLSKVDRELQRLWKRLYYDRVEIFRERKEYYTTTWEEFCRKEFQVDTNS